MHVVRHQIEHVELASGKLELDSRHGSVYGDVEAEESSHDIFAIAPGIPSLRPQLWPGGVVGQTRKRDLLLRAKQASIDPSRQLGSSRCVQEQRIQLPCLLPYPIGVSTSVNARQCLQTENRRRLLGSHQKCFPRLACYLLDFRPLRQTGKDS